MKKTFFSMPNALLLHALTTFLIGIGCTYPLSLSLGLTAPLSLSVGCCALVTLAFALLSCLPRLRALTYPLLLAVLCAFVFSLRGQMNAISAALTLLLNGHALALAAYSRALVVLFSLVFTGIGAALSRSEQAFFPLALLVIVLLFIVSFLGIEVGAFSLLPLVLALILSGRAPNVSAKRLIPMAAAALGIVALMMPMATQTVPELNDFARHMRQKIDDYLFFTEPRTTFSLSTTGYQPLGVSQPANPEEAPVMQVRTSGRTLLRGAIKNEYDGSAWTDSTSGRRYLLVNPRFILLRRNLFDLDRPEKALRSQLPQSELITVLMRSDSVSTLYLTQRFSALSGEGIVPYFSPASEVFGTRSLTLGDSYTFSGTRMSYDTQGVRDVVLTASQAPDQLLEGIEKPIFPFRPALNRRSMRWSRASRRTRRTILTAPPRCAPICEVPIPIRLSRIYRRQVAISYPGSCSRNGKATAHPSPVQWLSWRALQDCLPDISKAMLPFRTATAQPASHSEMHTHGRRSTSAALAG